MLRRTHLTGFAATLGLAATFALGLHFGHCESPPPAVVIDGNRIARNETTRLFRDSRGRTRLERTISPMLSALSSQAMPPIVLINDPVSGECYALHARPKVAYVIPWPGASSVVHPPVALGKPVANLSTPGFDLSGAPGFDFSA